MSNRIKDSRVVCRCGDARPARTFFKVPEGFTTRCDPMYLFLPWSHIEIVRDRALPRTYVFSTYTVGPRLEVGLSNLEMRTRTQQSHKYSWAADKREQQHIFVVNSSQYCFASSTIHILAHKMAPRISCDPMLVVAISEEPTVYDKIMMSSVISTSEGTEITASSHSSFSVGGGSTPSSSALRKGGVSPDSSTADRTLTRPSNSMSDKYTMNASQRKSSKMSRSVVVLLVAVVTVLRQRMVWTPMVLF
jgi:hypothetical protein